MKPAIRPRNPGFSCGPATKRIGWSPDALANAFIGRSHRAKAGKARIKQVCDEIHALLELPKDYKVGIITGSDTGAVECALWSMLGERPVDVFGWEAFSNDWVYDVVEQLAPLEKRGFIAPYGKLPPLHEAKADHDIIFPWNGTAAGLKVPEDTSWIADNPERLVICDATSAILSLPIPWEKLDVITFSWQKMLGGEAAHGVLIISPRAVRRLETYTPPWPLPKIFRLTKGGKLNEGIFEGETINTPSMICVEDVLDGMAWLRANGGYAGAQQRCQESFGILSEWVTRSGWLEFLTEDPQLRSPTSVCFKISHPKLLSLPEDKQREFCNKVVGLIETEGAGYDFNAYKDAPPGLRIWCGTTVLPDDIRALTAWIDWSFQRCFAEL